MIKEIEPFYGIKTIGLITGCFDVLHVGHLDIFRFAKKQVDILIVGIDTDEAIRKTKGNLRPVNSQENRARMLTSLEDVDYTLLLENKHELSSEEANDYYDNLVFGLKPNYLITSKKADNYISAKQKRIEKVGGKLLLCETPRSTSTSDIIRKILEL